MLQGVCGEFQTSCCNRCLIGAEVMKPLATPVLGGMVSPCFTFVNARDFTTFREREIWKL
jgi:hypothetical protein